MTELEFDFAISHFPKEMEEHRIVLKDVRIVNVIADRSFGHVLVEGNPEVEKVRVYYEYVRDGSWLREHIGCVVDMHVLPYEWKTSERSGTIYYLRGIIIKKESVK